MKSGIKKNEYIDSARIPVRSFKDFVLYSIDAKRGSSEATRGIANLDIFLFLVQFRCDSERKYMARLYFIII